MAVCAGYTASHMRVVDLIARTRDGGRLTREEIHQLVAGVTAGTIPEYQTAAWLMAVVWRGLDADQTAWLTDAMVRSGQRIDLSAIAGPTVGKHSTGGVGDKLSLIVVPIVAACGGRVLKTSGRALGHSGGTIDKLEAIAGFRVDLPMAECLAVLAEIGCAFVGQTADIAPADKKLYALRDVTGTIESVPLIASSIMSKKIAEGASALVLDVKVGRGAFMKTLPDARRLSEAMVEIGRNVGLPTRALLTAMDAPLGRAVGNALEVAEAVATLKGTGPADVTGLSVALASHMLLAAGLARDAASAETRVVEAIASGAAYSVFEAVVSRQGGDISVLERIAEASAAPVREVIVASRSGCIAGIDAERIGRASMMLGAGRERLDTPIHYGAGIVIDTLPGADVRAGQPLATLHAGRPERLDEARALVTQAFEIEASAPPASPLVYDVIS
jgi:pyrimidine-nucleoside phosphorylase